MGGSGGEENRWKEKDGNLEVGKKEYIVDMMERVAGTWMDRWRNERTEGDI